MSSSNKARQISSKTHQVVGRLLDRYRLRFRSALTGNTGQAGQATVEYALIGVLMVAVLIGFSALQHRMGEGLFVEHALRSASHAFGPNTAGVIGDVLLY